MNHVNTEYPDSAVPGTRKIDVETLNRMKAESEVTITREHYTVGVWDKGLMGQYVCYTPGMTLGEAAGLAAGLAANCIPKRLGVEFSVFSDEYLALQCQNTGYILNPPRYAVIKTTTITTIPRAMTNAVAGPGL